jgi:hypothetical protein
MKYKGWFTPSRLCAPGPSTLRAGLAIRLVVFASVAACSNSAATPQGGSDGASDTNPATDAGSPPENDATVGQPIPDAASADSNLAPIDAADAASRDGEEAADAPSEADAVGGEASAEASSDGSACGTAEVCDDFESYTGTDLAPWVLNTTNATLRIDTTHVFSGRQAVGIHIDTGANNAAQMTRKGAPVFPATPNLFWGRMMIYMTELPPAGVHYDIIQGDGQGTGQYRIGGMGTILLNYQPNDCYDHPNNPVPHDAWSCWQWLFDGTSNTIEFYIGGVLQTKVVNTGQGCVGGPATSVWAAPEFNAVHLGWVNYQATTAPVDLWIDAVALGPDQIACPATPTTAH